jgi:hypothetical protein
MVNDMTGSTHCYGKKKEGKPRPIFLKLPRVAALAGWPTPDTGSAGGRVSADPLAKKRENGSKKQFNLQDAVRIAGWATPCANQANGTPEAFLERKRKSVEKTGKSMGIVLTDLNMQVQAWTSGQTSTSSPAPTGKRGGLNPAFSAWLMGFPPEWCQAAIRAYRKLKPQRKLA